MTNPEIEPEYESEEDMFSDMEGNFDEEDDEEDDEIPETKTVESIHIALFTRSGERRILDRIAEAGRSFSKLKIVGLNDKAGAEAVRQARLSVKNERLNVEAIHKAEKAEALTYGQKLDAAKRTILAAIEPIELALKQKEDTHKAEVQAVKDAEQKILNDRAALRVALMAEVNGLGVVNPLDLSTMPQRDFEAHLSVATAKFKAQKEEAEAEALELQRFRLAASERIENEKIELERIALEKDKENASLSKKVLELEERIGAIIYEKTDPIPTTLQMPDVVSSGLLTHVYGNRKSDTEKLKDYVKMILEIKAPSLEDLDLSVKLHQFLSDIEHIARYLGLINPE